MKMSRWFATALISGALLVPGIGSTEHCQSRIVIFSSNSQVGPAVNSNAVTCLLLEHDADGRIINPGSDQVTVRYTIPGGGTCTLADPANQVPADTVQGTLNGLGLEDHEITLTCRYDATLEFYSFQTQQPAAIDPAATGCITAVIEDAQNSFHTVGTLSCPDGGF